MTKDNFNEECLSEQIKVMAYEGKLPCKPYIWACPSCENQNVDLYKRAKLICATCKNVFVFAKE